jgi:hypothetical protein
MSDVLLVSLLIAALLIVGIIGLLSYNYIRDILASLDENKLRVFILDRFDHFHRHYVTKKNVGKSAFAPIKNVDYEVVTKRVYRMGIFRVPTSFYEEGKKRPLSMRAEQEETDAYDGTDFQVVRKHRFVEQLISAFRRQAVSADMALMLIIGSVAVTGIAVYYMIGQKLDEINSVLRVLQNGGL